MSAKHMHHQIETIQQQVASLQSAVTSPVQGQEVLLEMLAALQAALQALHGTEGDLHQQAEAVLRDSEARTHAILQTAVDGIITIDARGLIESFNPAAERLFGYTADEVLGQNISMLMPSPYREEHDGYMARYLQTGEPHIIGIGREVRARRRDGSPFPIALAVSEVPLAGRRMFTGVVHDLTALVQETVQTLAHQIAQRQAQITVESLPTVIADRTAMEQIMGNLLANAVAYPDPDRPGAIVVTGERRPAVTMLHVRDNGRGIAAEDIPKVFEPFRRVGFKECTYAGATHTLPLLILLDLNLPRLDGFQVLTRLKADVHTRHIPVIILTTTDEPYEIERCYALGCNVYITKPVEYEQFAEAIRKLGLFLSIVKIPLGK